MTEPTAEENADWLAYHYLHIWLQSAIDDCESYLNASDQFLEYVESGARDWWPYRRKLILAEYHLLTVLEKARREVVRMKDIHPVLRAPYQAATQFRTETKDLRDKLEHAEEYFFGAKGGRHPETWTRTTPEGSLDGAPAGSCDASSTVSGWIGGRLHPPTVLAELRPILAAAQTIPEP